MVVTEDVDVSNTFVQWKNRIFTLGKELIDGSSLKIFNAYFLNENLTAERVGKDLVFNIPDKDYAKFVVVVSPQDNLVVISLLYYKN